MRELCYCSATFNDVLTLWEGAFDPEKISSKFEPEKLSKICAFKLTYKTGEGTINKETEQEALSYGFSRELASLTATGEEEFESEYCFIGDIVDFEQVKHLFKPDANLDEWKDRKYVVSYHDGEIYDMRPILGHEKWQAVDSKEELAEVFEQKTGCKFPLSRVK